MANHGFVTSRKKFQPEKITEALEALNQRVFKGLLVFKHCQQGVKPNHVWEVEMRLPNLDKNYLYRCFWLESSRKVEIRHGRGGDFADWVDAHILNEIALAFDGTISDEGIEERWPGEPNYCPTLSEFQNRMYDFCPKQLREQLIALQNIHGTPPEFQ